MSKIEEAVQAYVREWEKVWRERGESTYPFERWPPEAQDQQRRCIRAVIEAMREPSNSMKQAIKPGMDHAEAWCAMIDEALAEKPGA